MYFTIFTPTYNRAYLLGKAYKSLCMQSFKDFKWLIVDDGSEDNTEEIVAQWIRENTLNIQYIKQQNTGRFGAYNTAVPYFEGELVAFIDSDDIYKPNTLERLHDIWENRKVDYTPEPIGMIFYMEDSSGKIHGNELPDTYCDYLTSIRGKHKVNGDKGQAYKCDLIKQYTYPIFYGEKFIGDSLIFNRMAVHGGVLVIRESLYIRDYPEDSLTKNVDRVHYNSPKGMALYYAETMNIYEGYFVRRLNCAMKYVAFSRIAHQRIFNNYLTHKGMVALMYIPGRLYAKILKNRALVRG